MHQKVLKLAARFEKLALGPETLQPMDVEAALRRAGLWVDQFGETSSRTFDKIAEVVLRYKRPGEVFFSINCDVVVTPDLSVIVECTEAPHSEREIGRDLTRIFGPAMTQAVKRLDKDPPEDNLRVEWLRDAEY